MNDDEITRFLPRNFDIDAKTVVMSSPPCMTMHEGASAAEPSPAVSEIWALQEPIFDPRATRMKLDPRMTRMIPPPQEPILLQRAVPPVLPPPPSQAHMARTPCPAKQMLALEPSQDDFVGGLGSWCQTPASSVFPKETQTSVPLGARNAERFDFTKRSRWPVFSKNTSHLERPPARAESPANVAVRTLVSFCAHLREPAARKVIALGGGALALILVSLLAISSSSASPQSSAEPATTALNDPSGDLAAAQVAKPPPVPLVDATPNLQGEIESEQEAAATLLSGRPAEALKMYQALAAQENASPGVQAMAIVLSQQVETP